MLAGVDFHPKERRKAVVAAALSIHALSEGVGTRLSTQAAAAPPSAVSRCQGGVSYAPSQRELLGSGLASRSQARTSLSITDTAHQTVIAVREWG